MTWRDLANDAMLAIITAGAAAVVYAWCIVPAVNAADVPAQYGNVMVIAHCATQGCLPCEKLKADQADLMQSHPGLYWAWAMDGRRSERVSQSGRRERPYQSERIAVRSYPTIIVYRAGRQPNERWSEAVRLIGYNAGMREVLELAIKRVSE